MSKRFSVKIDDEIVANFDENVLTIYMDSVTNTFQAIVVEESFTKNIMADLREMMSLEIKMSTDDVVKAKSR